MPSSRLTERALNSLKPGATLWDQEVRGLGARRRGNDGRVIFVFKYRSPIDRDVTGRGRQRYITIGPWGRGDWGIDDARKVATAHRDALRLGRDPAADRDHRKAMPTVAELCDAYLAAVPNLLLRRERRPKKPSTIATDKSRIAAHIKPLLGSMPVDAISQRDVQRFMHGIAAGASAKRSKLGSRAVSNVRGGRGAASRTIGLLGSIFAYAVAEGHRPDNPVRGVTRYADGKRERRLSDEEYALLAAGLVRAQAEGVNPFGISCVRFLLLTGWRRGEATELRWSEVDIPGRTARLSDTKTGASMRPLAQPVVGLLQEQTRTGGPFVFPARSENKALQGLPRMWARIRALSQLGEDITLHTLRHSFASLAADLGYGDAAIAALIGHSRSGTTARYTHRSDRVLLKVADEVAFATLDKLQYPPAVAAPRIERGLECP
ncbi:tyrosine-type recombinase/integrase [Pararoseomonas indoligenes]|uniref:Tyrosine-type recombinase/integrase n=1 Tax=Roseomonas indoligenes TaxID=2820811 RepID=A0A940S444_9PROT|nr:site-specific integrase [Pararoseomonas indoligenes]MBP0491620.1 tyrosine-type recombinase/integrase [Pararoseomonas indoligenes]